MFGVRQSLFGEIAFSLDLDQEFLWDVGHEEVDHPTHREDHVLGKFKDSESRINQ